jgi:hypothetical protein
MKTYWDRSCIVRGLASVFKNNETDLGSDWTLGSRARFGSGSIHKGKLNIGKLTDFLENV